MLAQLKKKTNKNKKVLLKEVDSQDEFTESLTEESREASEQKLSVPKPKTTQTILDEKITP